MTRKLSLFIFALVALTASAQKPDADWRTIETAHFRVHYPREYEQWSMRAASRLESIRAEVVKEVGFAPVQKIDVLVGNPIALANGAAFPLLDTPRILFFAEPPGPDEQLGAYGHWIDLLAVHEVAHVVHMLRPSRNPLERLLEKTVLPLNPITLRAPRWVLEGYATVIEGRLTGAGRPSSTVRALILRRWAEAGRLPTYGQLNSDRRFLGMSMAYLMGSAYLEWLEQRSGPGSLRNLWSRLTARHRRSFNEAFIGVFGDSPDRLYGRFVAELTASSIALDRASKLQEGELFQETTRTSGDPAVSPDGKQIAVVIRAQDQPHKLVVWSTGAADEEERKFEERLKKILARDPEDVAPVRAKPLPRKAVHSLVMPDGGDIESPRWMRDGKSLLFSHRAPDAGGVLHFDLYRWDFETVTRVTHLADVRDADPVSATSAVAVRSRFGASQLVNVDLTTGVVTPRTEPSIDIVYTHPRMSPDGSRLAYVAHRAGAWSLYVDDRRVTLDGDASSPEWLPDGALVVTVSKGGFAELHRGTMCITRTRGGAFSPAPSRDGRLFFTSLEPDGFVVRVLPSIGEATAPPSFDPMLVPALPPAPPAATTFAAADLPAGRSYGLGRQELDWLTGTTYGPNHRAFEVGLRLGDVVGRLNTLLLASLASGDAPEGFALAGAWRGWPVEVHAHAFATSSPHPPSAPFDSHGSLRAGSSPLAEGRRGLAVPVGDGRRELAAPLRDSPSPRGSGERVAPSPSLRAGYGRVRGSHAASQDHVSGNGVELRGVWSRTFPLSHLTVEAGALSDDLLFGSAAFSTRQLFGKWRIEEAVRVDLDDRHYRASLGAAIRSGSFRLSARYQHDGGDTVTLGGLSSSILPRSAHALRVLDPALPVATLTGREYDGWRVESTVPSMPFTAFYQRHQLGGETLSLAGLEVDVSAEPFPIMKMPGFDLTAGVAKIIDGDTNWWLGMRWRP